MERVGFVKLIFFFINFTLIFSSISVNWRYFKYTTRSLTALANKVETGIFSNRFSDDLQFSYAINPENTLITVVAFNRNQTFTKMIVHLYKIYKRNMKTVFKMECPIFHIRQDQNESFTFRKDIFFSSNKDYTFIMMKNNRTFFVLSNTGEILGVEYFEHSFLFFNFFSYENDNYFIFYTTTNYYMYLMIKPSVHGIRLVLIETVNYPKSLPFYTSLPEGKIVKDILYINTGKHILSFLIGTNQSGLIDLRYNNNYVLPENDSIIHRFSADSNNVIAYFINGTVENQLFLIDPRKNYSRVDKRTHVARKVIVSQFRNDALVFCKRESNEPTARSKLYTFKVDERKKFHGTDLFGTFFSEECKDLFIVRQLVFVECQNYDICVFYYARYYFLVLVMIFLVYLAGTIVGILSCMFPDYLLRFVYRRVVYSMIGSGLYNHLGELRLNYRDTDSLLHEGDVPNQGNIFNNPKKRYFVLHSITICLILIGFLQELFFLVFSEVVFSFLMKYYKKMLIVRVAIIISVILTSVVGGGCYACTKLSRVVVRLPRTRGNSEFAMFKGLGGIVQTSILFFFILLINFYVLDTVYTPYFILFDKFFGLAILVSLLFGSLIYGTQISLTFYRLLKEENVL